MEDDIRLSRKIKEYKEQITKDFVEYWIELVNEEIGTIESSEIVIQSVLNLRDSGLLNYFTINDTGIFAYIICNNFKGQKCLSEVLFYIRKESRGSLRLVKDYIIRAEKLAIDNSCQYVTIGSNLGYKEKSFEKLLKRTGYVTDTLSRKL